MKKTVLLFIAVISFSTYAQSPGGVSGSEIWCKVKEVTTTGSTTSTTFQYKDFSSYNKAIALGTGTVLAPAFFNYNYSFTYDDKAYVSYLSKLEKLKEATIFIVNLPTPPLDPSTKYGLMNTDWKVNVPTGSVNEQSFAFSTSTFEKDVTSLTYSTGAAARPNGRINTLLWHDFKSKKIVNSFGSNGESSIFIGKAFTGASNFVGQIPEVIVYRKALNDKEKGRVESYLALKYGITLQPEVNYYTSKNEIFWNKDNNGIFKNRIFGLGRDSNSSLNQKQSTSVHDPSVQKRMIFWLGSLQEDNNQNNSFIEDQNFLTIGDNADGELLSKTQINGIKRINRTWLVEKFGSSAHNLNTNLKYKPDSIVALLPNEAFWLIVDKSAGNKKLSNFKGANVSYYPVTNLDANRYAVFNNLKWGSDTTTYNQFTFGKGPRMLIVPKVLPLACTDTKGIVNIAIKGGKPNFTINVNGIDNSYNLQLTQPTFNLSLSLNTGQYQVSVTDATGYTQTSNFEISPTPGIALALGADQYLMVGKTISLNASLQVTSTEANYQWFKDGILVATTSTLSVSEAGTYKCIITDINTDCSVEDSVRVMMAHELLEANYSGIYPNPVNATEAFNVKVHLDHLASVSVTVFDVLGKVLETRNLMGSNEYVTSFKLNTAGIYFIQIESPKYSTINKIIIH
jgi:hypothetical protein